MKSTRLSQFVVGKSKMKSIISSLFSWGRRVPRNLHQHYILRPVTVLRQLRGADIAIFYSILIYIGLIVSDPATSPFYAIESALEYVGHDHIMATMIIVLLVALSVAIGYAAIGFRFNKGEGGTGLVFEWMGSKPSMWVAASMLIDFILTDAVTMAATVAAVVSLGLVVNRYLLALIVFVVVGVLLRLGDKGRLVFALMSFGFMFFILYAAFSPVVDSAQIVELEAGHEIRHEESHIPDTSGVAGFAAIPLLLFGAVRGFALLTGFEASVSALSHEEEKPKYARIAMGVGTVILVLLFTSIVTLSISSTAANLQLIPDEHHTLFSLWTKAKVDNAVILSLLGMFSAGILLSGAASGATAGGGLVHVLVKSKILPKKFTHIDDEHNDYKAMLIIHVLAFVIVLLFAVDEFKIVSFYAISVLIGFSFTLLAAIRFAIKTKTNYLLAAIPGFFMVMVALAINLARYEGLVIIILVYIIGNILHKRWVAGGKQVINFSH